MDVFPNFVSRAETSIALFILGGPWWSKDSCAELEGIVSPLASSDVSCFQHLQEYSLSHHLSPEFHLLKKT